MQIVGNWENTLLAKPLMPFDDGVLDFFNDLSKILTKERKYSDVATFGFWCRKASLLKEKSIYDDLGSRLGRGVIFHSTPSNVPVNFAFSFAAGLLSGNANIVRLPGKDFEQVSIIVEAIRSLLSHQHEWLAPYICFVKYPPNKKSSDLYSSVCDTRMVWGGDKTISEMRESPLKPRATELTFADRYSVAVINANEYIKADNKQGIAQAFYNDTYFSDQNACTAPRIVFWMGKQKDEAKILFWESLEELVKKEYELAPVQAVGKLSAFYKAAARVPAQLESASNNYVTRAKVSHADKELTNFFYNSGFFFDQDIEALEDILPICGERLQTLVYYGFSTDDIRAFIIRSGPKGIDRAVPMGKSMDFSLVWDGYDLIRELSRKVIVI